MKTSTKTKTLILAMFAVAALMLLCATKMAMGNVETKIKSNQIAEASTEMFFLENGEYMVVNK